MFTLLLLKRAINLIRRQSETIFGIETDKVMRFPKLRAMELDVEAKYLPILPIAYEIVSVAAGRTIIFQAKISASDGVSVVILKDKFSKIANDQLPNRCPYF